MRPAALLLLPAVLPVVLVAGLLSPPAGARVPDDLEVTGWILGSSAPEVVAANAGGITTLSVVGVTLSADGAGVSAPGSDARRLLRSARRHGLAAELLVSNWSNRLGRFDRHRNRALLSHPGRIRQVASRLAHLVTAGGWDGVNIDLEGIRTVDGGGLVDLARTVQARLPDDRTVSIDVGAATSVRAYRERGYRLRGLARAVDVVDLMTYDQHGPGWSGPGPVGALPWQRHALAAALEVVPARKVQLGVAGYGYTWPTTGTGRSVTDAQARRIVRRDGARARWRDRAGEWTARLSDGTVLWWSDGRSYRRRVTLAQQSGVRGLAVWRLGSADTLR